MRQAFIEVLTDQAILNKDIILLTGDLGFTVFEEFQKLLPSQFINVGVAEANMISLSAGLALTGKIPVAYSIASFSSSRPYEQIKLDVALHNLPVIIVGIGSGMSYSTASVTHHCLDDIAIMNAVPNMTILSPCSSLETKWAVKTAVKLGKPVYLRLSKNNDPEIYNHKPLLKLGKGSLIQKGKDLAILATGMIMPDVMKAVKLLQKKNLDPTVVSMHTLKPFDHHLVARLAQTHKLIITVEEHSINGGLGSIVAHSLMTSPNTQGTDTKQFRLNASNTPGVGAKLDSRRVYYPSLQTDPLTDGRAKRSQSDSSVIARNRRLAETKQSHAISGLPRSSRFAGLPRNDIVSGIRFLPIAVPDKFITKIGSLSYLRSQTGLSSVQIAHKILKEL